MEISFLKKVQSAAAEIPLFDWVLPACIFMFSRIIVFLCVALLSLHGFESGAHLIRWDAEHYVSIAEFGYQFNGAYRQEGALAAFFPFFPMVISGTASLLGILPSDAGLLISFICGTASAILLYKLVSSWKNKEVGLFAVVLFSFYPYGVFLSAPYTESLFMFLTLLFLYVINKKSYLYGAFIVGVSCITRITGGILGLLLVYEVYRQKSSKIKIILYGLIALIPLHFFILFQYAKYGTPLAFKLAQAINWNQHTVFPWEGLVIFYHRVFTTNWAKAMLIQDGFILTIMLATLALSFKKIPRNVWYMGCGVVLLTLVSDNILGMGRYMILCIPFYYYWAEVLHSKKTLTYMFLGLMVSWFTLSTIIFSLKKILF